MIPGKEVRRILVVDDEESIRLLMRRILESIPKIEVTLAEGSEEALKLAAAGAYDLILLDLLMPGIGGIELLSRIRSASANRTTPVIIVSVLEDPHTKMACRSLGVSDYVVKPIERTALLAAVNAAISTPQSSGGNS